MVYFTNNRIFLLLYPKTGSPPPPLAVAVEVVVAAMAAASSQRQVTPCPENLKGGFRLSRWRTGAPKVYVSVKLSGAHFGPILSREPSRLTLTGCLKVEVWLTQLFERDLFYFLKL